MPGPLKVNERVEIPEAELHWKFSRSSGPGGQSVNTADSRVELSFDVMRSIVLPLFLKERASERLSDRLVDGVLRISASENRSQYANRIAAEKRMAEVLARAFAAPRPPRRPTKPTRSSRRVRVDDKRKRGEIKRGRQKPGDND